VEKAIKFQQFACVEEERTNCSALACGVELFLAESLKMRFELKLKTSIWI
jgi:hypothetical protein